MCLLNKSDEKKTVLVDFALLAQAGTGRRSGGSRGGAPLTIENYRLRDLWEHKDLALKETLTCPKIA